MDGDAQLVRLFCDALSDVCPIGDFGSFSFSDKKTFLIILHLFSSHESRLESSSWHCGQRPHKRQEAFGL